MSEGKTNFVIDPKKPTVVMTRVFDAPPAAVFEAMTKPEHVARWYGPHGYTVSLCEIDLRPGGAYRIVNRAPDGNEHGFKGEYREVVPSTRLVYTWIFEPLPDKVALVTETFADQAGKTMFSSTTLFETVQDRDGFLRTGATEGGAQSMDRVAALLPEIQERQRDA